MNRANALENGADIDVYSSLQRAIDNERSRLDICNSRKSAISRESQSTRAGLDERARPRDYRGKSRAFRSRRQP